MKPSIFLISMILLFSPTMLLGQRSEILLTYNGMFNGQYAKLDSILIENLDRHCDTLLRWPDTAFHIPNVGINDIASSTALFQVFQNYPNPVEDHTEIRIYVPESGLVNADITDFSGNVIASVSKELTKGFHTYSFVPGHTQMYLFTATFREFKQSIKVVASLKNQAATSSLTCVGTTSAGTPFKSVNTSGSFRFALNDNLKVTAYHIWVKASILYAPVENKTDTINFSLYPCGSPMTINHISGVVAPVSKTVIYNTVYNVPGEPAKCWITSNLGASRQATAADDATEASAGWYWQFNRKQGYMHDGQTRTPNTIWEPAVNQPQYWLTANDPCGIELGDGWHVPTFTEWFNVDQSGNWTDPNGPWSSDLKLHLAGALNIGNGSLVSRGSYGFYWSSKSSWYVDDYYGMYLVFYNTQSKVDYNNKAYGYSVRCVR